MKSLGARLLVTLGVLLVVGFGLTVAVLDFSFRARAARAREAVLEAHVVALIAAAELDRTGRLAPPDPIADPRLDIPGSGFVLEIHTRRGVETWRSRSGLGLTLHLDDNLAPGERRVHEVAAPDGTRFLVYSLGVSWDVPRARPREYVFSAVESLEPYYRELARLRAELLGGFAALTAVLLVAVLGVLRVLLQPLRRIEAEIAEVEAGRRERLGSRWPRELEGVAHNLNALLGTENARLERYRNVVGDLAHSLKTPLSVMRGALSAPDGDRALLNAQVDRMEEIVRHQLQRAAATAPAVGVAALPVAAQLETLAGALRKVHVARGLEILVTAPPTLAPPIDRGDFLEVAGNLADNACKWARTQVRIEAVPWEQAGWRRAGLVLRVQDDGPGIPAGDAARVRHRGVRLDEQVPGQGLGLAMVDDILKAYRGELTLEAADGGGLLATARWPGA
jgi:two-component system sensor histidine kinase PhoQ